MTATKNVHRAIAPDGSALYRTSKARTYSHVVVAFNTKAGVWRDLGWSSRLELAEKNLRSYATLPSNTDFKQRYADLRILEAELI